MHSSVLLALFFTIAASIAAPPAAHALPIVRGHFVSTQVNVNAQGQNIVGDAANEPSIAVDPTDRNNLVIAWKQFPIVTAGILRQAGWAYSHDAGATWTFRGVLDHRPRSDPALDADAAGNFYYYSLGAALTPSGRIELFGDLFISRDRGLSWEPPVRAFGGDKPWMVVDRTAGIGAGNIYASWSSGEFTRSTDGGQTFLPPLALPERPSDGTLAVGPEGELYVVGNSAVGLIVDKSTNAQDPAAITAFTSARVDLGGIDAGIGAHPMGPNPGGLLGQPWIATDLFGAATRGNVYVLQSVDPPGADPLDVMFVRSTDGGVSWSAPLRINDDFTAAWQWFGALSVAPNGRIDAIWNDTRNDPTAMFSEVYSSWSLDGGVTWSANQPVTPPFNQSLGYPGQSPADPGSQKKLGDYCHMVSDNGGANLAYAATFNGEQDVYFVRLPADCNGNGIEDDCEIACGPARGRCDVTGCGTGTDRNGDSILDACQSGAALTPAASSTPRPTPTPTPPPRPCCTAPPCNLETEVYYCPDVCPCGCGTICATRTATARPPTATPTPSVPSTASCGGDCNADGEVTIDELLTMVAAALGTQSASDCVAGDINSSAEITIDEIVAAVGAALNGCPPGTNGGVRTEDAIERRKPQPERFPTPNSLNVFRSP